MKQTRILMDMPIIVEINDISVTKSTFSKIFSFFEYIDNKFSIYKENSEISKINHKKIPPEKYSRDMSEVLKLCDFFKNKTCGYFDIINEKGLLDPSGLVKGWSIYKTSLLLKEMGFSNFYINAGGDIEVSGLNNAQKSWTIGIQHPKLHNKVVKRIVMTQGGVATSGTYERGNHIYDPYTRKSVTDIISLTVIGPNILEADVYATAAFAMGKNGIKFIGNLKEFAGYMIDRTGFATFTQGFGKYVLNA